MQIDCDPDDNVLQRVPKYPCSTLSISFPRISPRQPATRHDRHLTVQVCRRRSSLAERRNSRTRSTSTPFQKSLNDVMRIKLIQLQRQSCSAVLPPCRAQYHAKAMSDTELDEEMDDQIMTPLMDPATFDSQSTDLMAPNHQNDQKSSQSYFQNYPIPIGSDHLEDYKPSQILPSHDAPPLADGDSNTDDDSDSSVTGMDAIADDYAKMSAHPSVAGLLALSDPSRWTSDTLESASVAPVLDLSKEPMFPKPIIRYAATHRKAALSTSFPVRTGDLLISTEPSHAILSSSLLMTHCSACFASGRGGHGAYRSADGMASDGLKVCPDCEACVFCDMVGIIPLIRGKLIKAVFRGSSPLAQDGVHDVPKCGQF